MSYYFYLGSSLPHLSPTQQLPSFYSALLPFYTPLPDASLLWQANDPFKHVELAITTTDSPSPPQTAGCCVPAEPCPPACPCPGEKSIEKERLSAKKNSESNIINQFYSFFSSREKSERVMVRCAMQMGKEAAAAEKMAPAFYAVVRYINARRGRKYVNLAMFLRFFEPDHLQTYLGEVGSRIAQTEQVPLGEVCQIFRRCARYFFKVVSPAALLTSKRISAHSKSEHLKKLRKISAAVQLQ